MDSDERIALYTEVLIEIEKQTLEIEKRALHELALIRKWVVFFGILTVIGLVVGLFSLFASIPPLETLR